MIVDAGVSRAAGPAETRRGRAGAPLDPTQKRVGGAIYVILSLGFMPKIAYLPVR